MAWSESGRDSEIIQTEMEGERETRGRQEKQRKHLSETLEI